MTRDGGLEVWILTETESLTGSPASSLQPMTLMSCLPRRVEQPLLILSCGQDSSFRIHRLPRKPAPKCSRCAKKQGKGDLQVERRREEGRGRGQQDQVQ